MYCIEIFDGRSGYLSRDICLDAKCKSVYLAASCRCLDARECRNGTEKKPAAVAVVITISSKRKKTRELGPVGNTTSGHESKEKVSVLDGH